MSHNPELGHTSTGFRGARTEMEVAADLMNRGFYVYRNQSPVGPIDMLAVSPRGEVLRVQATCGDLSHTGVARFNPHEDVPYWDVLAVGFDDEVRYFTRKKEEIALGTATKVTGLVAESPVPVEGQAWAVITKRRPRKARRGRPQRSPPPEDDWEDTNIPFSQWRHTVQDVLARLGPRVSKQARREALTIARRELAERIVQFAQTEGMDSHWWKRWGKPRRERRPEDLLGQGVPNAPTPPSVLTNL
jgi:hypothetical protein